MLHTLCLVDLLSTKMKPGVLLDSHGCSRSCVLGVQQWHCFCPGARRSAMAAQLLVGLCYLPAQILVQLPGRNGTVWRQGTVGIDGWGKGRVCQHDCWKATHLILRLDSLSTPLWMRVPGPGFAPPSTFSHHLHRCNTAVKHYYPHSYGHAGAILHGCKWSH